LQFKIPQSKIDSIEGAIMSTTSSGSGQSDGETTPAPEGTSDPQPSGGTTEMQRQMEAPRERMRKYHAVYKRPPEKPGA
jgi:hypothetical protein